MNSFFRELKQRKVYRVAVGYAVVAWLVVQISATVMPAYHAPEWILPLFITAMALGFPVALVLAWVFDIKGGAIKKAPESTVATVSGANKRRVWLLAAVGLIISALAIGGYWLRHPWRKALTVLQPVLQTPYGGWLYSPAPITPALLRLDPRWDPLRANPAFQKLCEEKQP